MSFMPNMTARTRALRVTRPLSWRRWDGVVADVWHARSEIGGGGYYVSPDPRLIVFLGGAPPAMGLRLAPSEPAHEGVGAFYIPAGVPLWSEAGQAQDYAHLDLHLQAGPLQRRLAACLAQTPSRAPSRAGQEPVFAPHRASSAQIAGLIADQVRAPSRPSAMLDGLLSALLCDVFDACAEAPVEGTGPEPEAAHSASPIGDLPLKASPPALQAALPPHRGGLAPSVLRRIEAHVESHLEHPISVTALADLAGLSESWFPRAFRQSTGQTPQRWLAQRRATRAVGLLRHSDLGLAEIAARCGFADQAHFSRVFRTLHGKPPARWRREISADPCK